MPPPLRIDLIDPDEAARCSDWLSALSEFDPRRIIEEGPARNGGGATKVLKAEGGSLVIRTMLAGRAVVVKSARLGGVVGRVRAMLRLSRAHRHWRGAEVLAGLGVRTARPLVLAQRGGEQFLVLEALDGLTVLEHLARPGIARAEERALARAVGVVVSRLHLGNRFNRDHKPSNLIVTNVSSGASGGAGGIEVAVIDCVGIQSSRGMSPEQPLARMLASLLLEPLGCGVAPRLAQRRRVLREALRASWEADAHRAPPARVSGPELTGGQEGQREVEAPAEVGFEVGFEEWERLSGRVLWRAAAQRVLAHGDPTPRVDPLAPS